MDNITEVKIVPLENPRYVRPMRMNYKQDGIDHTWELIKVHNSVLIYIYNKTRDVSLFVKQFRPPVFYSQVPDQDKVDTIDTAKYSGSLGITLELCAGIIDKDLSTVEIAKEEILEECGYDVPVSSIKEIQQFRAGVGLAGDTQTLFYCEVTDDQKVSSGGGNPGEGEFIHVVEMTRQQLGDYCHKISVQSAPGFLYSCTLFLAGYFDKYKE